MLASERNFLDGLVVQLRLQLLVLGHLPHGLHEILVKDIVALWNDEADFFLMQSLNCTEQFLRLLMHGLNQV